MKNPFNRQSQFELFPGAEGPEPRKERSYFFGRIFRFSFENLIIAGIVFLLAMVIAFSFGMEKGRRLNRVVATPDMRRSVDVIPKDAAASPLSIPKLAVDVVPEVVVEAGSVQSTPSLALVSAPEGENPSEAEKSVDKTAPLETIHTIQVASFKQLNRAEREASDLKKMGYEAFTVLKGSYYIVCVGRFSEKKQAQTVLRPLRKRYSDCYVRRL